MNTTVNADLGTLDALDTKLRHLNAMLVAIYGGGFESFSNLNGTLQDNYLWACAALSEDALNLVRNLNRAKLA